MNDKKKHFETASATTDPDNQNSGSFAYVITGICVAALIAVGVLGVGCTSLVVSSALNANSGAPSSGGFMSEDLPFDEDLQDLENFLEQYGDPGATSPTGSGSRPDSTQSTSVEVGEALGFELSLYGECIDDEVSASSYAGTPDTVRQFVRDLVGKDRDYTQKATTLVNDAARNEDTRNAKIKEAVALCEEASKTLGSLELPKVDKDEKGEVGDALGSAKSKAQERWDQMRRELSLLDTTDKVQTRKLWNYDDDVLEATEEAGSILEEAMATAAQL